ALRVSPASLQRLHLLLDRGVERTDVVRSPHDVRRHAGAYDRCPVLAPIAVRMPCVRVERETEVTQHAAPMVGEEAVRTMPTFPVGGVVRVDVDVPAIVVERVAPWRGGKAVDALAVVGEPAEDVADPAMGPVLG